MCDFGIPFVCIQCGTDQNPCHVKIVGPTLGFGVGVLSAYVGQPRSSSAAALRKWVKRAPVDINGQVSNAIPF
ncbi:hypothetical protein BHYA_0173g00020 [Botrytis hyacinthi]|uniref:Uncharacterized protein n=1 Tax=Botrytis hyacinthi TaxID=278943 RepID=A0A4Z1GFW1_9HELO|nr:hypothetical protein BHYA_0173g00020 [Botrytis hyacinthi]